MKQTAQRPAARPASPATAAPAGPDTEIRVRATKFGFNGAPVHPGTVFTTTERHFCADWMVRVDASTPDDQAQQRAQAAGRAHAATTRVARPGLETTLDAGLPTAAGAPPVAPAPPDSGAPTGDQNVLGD